MTLDLPSPPTVNTYWRRQGNRYFISKRGRAFKAATCAAWVRKFGYGSAAFPTKPVRVDITWRRPRAIGDVDNIAKPVLDALIGLAYTDDGQVVDLRLTRTDDKRNPGCTVTIQQAP